MSAINWRIFYTDGSTFDSSQGSPQDAPEWGVICIVQHDADVGRTIMRRWDFYYFHPIDQNFWGCDIFGYIDIGVNGRPFTPGSLKIGCTISTPQFQEILSIADSDPAFKPKSGRKEGETP